MSDALACHVWSTDVDGDTAGTGTIGVEIASKFGGELETERLAAADEGIDVRIGLRCSCA